MLERSRGRDLENSEVNIISYWRTSMDVLAESDATSRDLAIAGHKSSQAYNL